MAIAEESAVPFSATVGKIFEQRCLRCHSHEKSKGGLSLSSRQEFLKGGESGPAVVPRHPEQSLLLDMITGPDPQMPAEGTPLSSAEVEQVRAWVESGGDWPEKMILAEKISGGKDWWSFQPVQVSPVPDVQNNGFARNDIDRFILAKLEQAGLTPSSEADRRALIRRLSFDLLGLPPSPEDVAAFMADQDPLAYENLVDRMLKSPHYGERWARHWLDIAHYADTHGFERDQRRDNAWPYRDYVIQSLNADKPYNEFLREQIAGDVLRPDDPEALAGVGFLAAGPWDFVGQAETGSPTLRRAARSDDLDDMVTQVMATSIGLTVNCARCHDHKLDPILQKEYYQLVSVFAGVRRGDRDSQPTQAREIEDRRLQLLKERDVASSRSATLRGTHLDLADLVGGGNGHGTGQAGNGIDPLTGEPMNARRGFLEGVTLNSFRTSSGMFIDGVVVPDASDAGTTISSTGLKVDDVPKTSGQVWDAIRNGPVNSQFSTRLGETDFASAGHSLLALHANAGVTFDLNEMRKAGEPDEMTFTTHVGYFGRQTPQGASFAVYVDGELKASRVGLERNHVLVSVNIDLPKHARFLTLMATDNGNGIGNDQICFGDPWLSPSHPPELDQDRIEELKTLEARMVQLEQELKSLPVAAKIYGVVSDAVPPPVHVLGRGDPEQPLDEVQPGTLSCLQGMGTELNLSAGPEGERRRALAEWIVDPANPLTRRVMVNRLWHHHFGIGLVDTPSDFGFGGGRPSHSELLDWLANELLVRKWSLKEMHRLICTSATYRQQSSNRRPHEESVDIENRLLWRMNPRRLDAESLWDATLTVSGKLNARMFGPGFEDFTYVAEYAPIYRHITADSPELWRRAIYRFIVRTTPHQFLTTLDCPNPANLTPVRNVTTTALQSLAMLNNDFMLRQSDYLAERVQLEGGETSEGRVGRLFQLTFGRAPTIEESSAAIRLLETSGLPQLCRMMLNANEFIHID